MKRPQGASDLYNAMVAPLGGNAIKGVLWYQGESNADRAFEYRFVLAGLIRNWRRVFHSSKLPFLIVELAPFELPAERNHHDWAAVRESQQWIVAHDAHAATVSIVDLGDESEHPPRKREVGERLALAARRVAYGQQLASDGPLFENFTIEGAKAIVQFKNAAGLHAVDGDLIGFSLAGEDGEFHPAKASIQGDLVVATSDHVLHPRAVRLGWDNYPKMNLANEAGLPAHPFRSDQPSESSSPDASALSSASAN
jgi:sialate O-acetylesterase